MERYAPLVHRIARNLKSLKPAFLERDDVLQDGMIGLLRAIRSHNNEGTDAQFTAYLKTHIRGSIIDAYRAASPISRSDYEEAKKIREDAASGKEVCLRDLQEADMVYQMAYSAAVSIDEDILKDNALASPEPGPDRRAESNQLLRKAVDALQQIPIRDRNIFIACELAGEKQAAMAKHFSISHGRISQIIVSVRQAVLKALA